MQLFALSELLSAHAGGGRSFHEFLLVAALSAGIYVLPAGSADPQQPHAEDEIYHVLSGRARAVVAGDARAIAPGDTLYVAAHVEHRFVEISEDLTLLVVFAPAHAAG